MVVGKRMFYNLTKCVNVLTSLNKYVLNRYFCISRIQEYIFITLLCQLIFEICNDHLLFVVVVLFVFM